MNTQVTLSFIANSPDEFKAAIDALRTLPANTQTNVSVNPPLQSTSERGPREEEYLRLAKKAFMRVPEGRDREGVAEERIREWKEKNGQSVTDAVPVREYEEKGTEGETVIIGEFSAEDIQD